MYLDAISKCEAIIEWKTRNKHIKFDSSLFENILQYYQERGEISVKQEKAIENVYSKWRINKWVSLHRKKTPDEVAYYV